MKKQIKLLSFTVVSFCMVSCSSTETKETTESNTPISKLEAEAPAEIVYEPFDIIKINGSWKAIDAKGYSKDKILGQIYTFGDTSATFYASYGEGGMENADFIIENNQVIFSVSKEDLTYGGTSTMTTKYTGGFVGDKLVLKSQSEEITLTKQ